MKPGCSINTVIRLNNLTELYYILCAINPFLYVCVLGKILNLALQKKLLSCFYILLHLWHLLHFFLFDFLIARFIPN